MASNTDYTRLTYQQMLEDFSSRVKADERFKNISNASIYEMFMEQLTAEMDQTNFFMQRTAEEAMIDTARLDSSVIKYAKNLGYSPKRATPAEAEIAIRIKGPLPASLKAGATIYFAQENTKLQFQNKPFMLGADYSYTFDAKDIAEGKSATWSKTLIFARPADNMHYYKIGGIKKYSTEETTTLKAFQGELKVQVFEGAANLRKIGKIYQIYDVDNLKFSNWYGRRDPNAYSRGKYYNASGYTKVGIGKTQDEAFDENNLFEIEDYSIYLNDTVLKTNEINDDFSKLKVCAITTNQDKTVRLQFGDGVLVERGLLRTDDNIYIQYIETDGDEANMLGTKGSMFSTSNKFIASQEGGLIDLTSNIQILINSDITMGTAFESRQSIKNQAPRYFASAGRLLTRSDFLAFLNSLTAPIKVKTSNVWGQDSVEEMVGGELTVYKYLQNNIMYCVAGSPYIINGKINSVRNVLDEDDNTFGAFTPYGSGTAYIDHLCDYSKLLLSYNSFVQQQYDKNPSEQWVKNIKKIRDLAEDKMILGSKFIAMPPYVQYFDVVGNIEIDSLAKMQDLKISLENKIYEWLADHAEFGTPIYKSDIQKIINTFSEIKYSNIDIKVSDLIQSNEESYIFNDQLCSGTMIYDKSIDDNPREINVSRSPQRYYNVIKLPLADSKGNPLSLQMLQDKNIYIEIASTTSKAVEAFMFTPSNVVETAECFSLELRAKRMIDNSNFAYKCNVTLKVSEENDFVSTSSFSPANAALYGLSATQFGELQQFLAQWIKEASVQSGANRPIPLDYFVYSMDPDGQGAVETRAETIKRVGAFGSTLEKRLTEESFWKYVVPAIISRFYTSNNEIADEDVNGELWNKITSLVTDIYSRMKAVFCDSVLDDNNNIVNFTLDNELPIVRLNLTYKYKS